MGKKALKYVLAVVVLGVVLANSVYIRDLDEMKAAATVGKFDASGYAQRFWDNGLLPSLDRAIEVNHLVGLLHSNRQKAFADHSNALGIGNIRFFLVKGTGSISAVEENEVVVQISSATAQRPVRIATEYVFGNAVRDASGLIDINEFDNTMHFNNVSAEINQIIRKQVLPPFKAGAEVGKQVEFTGALELNQEHLNLENLEVIPVHLRFLD